MRKTTNKILSALIAASLVFGMVTTASAASEGDTAPTAASVQETVETSAEDQQEPAAEETVTEEPAAEDSEEQKEEAPAAAEEEKAEEQKEEAPAEEAPAEEIAPAEEAAPAEEVAPAEEEAVETVSEPEEETVAAMPAQTFSKTVKEKVKGKKKTVVKVEVSAPEGAFPEGTEMTVTKVGENDRVGGRKRGKTYRQAIESVARSDVKTIMAVDITFTKDGKEIEPAKDISVSFKSDSLAAKEGQTLSIVHIADDGSAEVIKDAKINENKQEATFDAGDFSVYAVLGEGETGENARLFVTFKQAGDGEDDIVIPVKKTDITTETIDGVEVNHFEQVLYDPGVGSLADGQMFKGWTRIENYTDETEALTIDDVRDEVKTLLNKGVTEGQEITYYPMIFSVRYVSYFDELGSTIRVDSVIFKAGESKTYTIDEPYSPYTSEAKFVGWAEAEQDSETGKYKEKTGGTVYQINNTITLNDSSDQVYIIAKVPAGHWLIFVENGDGASYTYPQFLESEARTEKPSAPTRKGYTFDGWYTGPPATTGGDPTGEEFTAWNQTLSVTTKLYAKWVAQTEAPYTVIIWLQQQEGNKYDFSLSLQLNGTTGQTVNSIIPMNTGNTDVRDDYARINNVNFYRSFTYGGNTYDYTGFHFSSYNSDRVVEPEGNTVINVYYDRNEYTLTFQSLPVATSTSTGYYYIFDDSYNIQQVYLRRYNGRWYNGNTEHTGGVYTGNTYSTVKTITARYGAIIKDEFPIVGSNNYTYNKGERWKPQTPNGEGWSEVMFLIETMPHSDITFTVNYPSRPLKTMEYYVEALPGESGTVSAPTTLYSGSNNTQVSPGNRKFTLYNSASARYNGVTVEDLLDLTGFKLIGVDSRMDNRGFYVYSTTEDNTLKIYYERLKYPITYWDGICVNADDQKIADEANLGYLDKTDDIYFGLSLADYSDYYTPERTGYVFEGWCIDDTCTTFFDFANSTMPLGGVKLYAKWRKIQYRVFLHPNVPASEIAFASDDPPTGSTEGDDSFGMGYQSTSFRIYYGESIATFNARREDYELIGWYTDEGLTNAFNFDAFVANDSNVTTPYIDKTEPTELDDWGNPTDTINKDKNLNRFWISKQLNLYAKWRSKLIGAKGIQVEYNAVETTEDGTTLSGHFADGSALFKDPVAYYNDNSESVGQGASSIDESGYEFKYWVLQTWDAENGKYVDTDTTVLPGATFTVLKSMAKEESIGTQGVDDYYLAYTVRLRAHYGSIEAPTPTHITWYSNIKDVAGNELDKTKFAHPTDDYENGKGWFVEDKRVAYNKGYNIKPANTYSYPGYTFLGWAKLDDDKSPEDKVLTEDDLFLKWVVNDQGVGHFEAKNDVGVWVTVTEVAADENQPYDDLYAVWKGSFYIYHSGVAGDGNLETIDMPAPGETYNLIQNLTDDTLYGGYYLNYAGKGDYKDDGVKGTNGVKYNGWNYEWSGAQEANEATAGSDDYKDQVLIHPEAGRTYYIKEVPTYYLRNYHQLNYMKTTQELKALYLISAVDDENYSKYGVTLTNGDKEVAIYTYIKFTNYATNRSVTLTAKSMFGASFGLNEEGRDDAVAKGHDRVTFWDATKSEYFKEGSFTVKPFWVTKDGVKVSGVSTRTINITSMTRKGVTKVDKVDD